MRQGRRQDIFQGGSEGYILDFPGGVRDQIFADLYGQNKKIAESGGQPTPWPSPCRRPLCDGRYTISRASANGGARVGSYPVKLVEVSYFDQ